MDVVRFITSEDNDDLILAFSFDEGTEFGIDGLIIQRTPKFEFILHPDERGPLIDWTDSGELILIKKVKLNRKNIHLRTQYEKYSFDLREITDQEFSRIIEILQKMNFDDNFELHIKH